MFDRLIEIALKSALENPEIKEKLRSKNEEIKIGLTNKNKIIDLRENDFGVFEAK